MTKSPIDLIIFDCDGVLADSEIISARVLVRQVAAHGVVFDETYVYTHFVGKSFPVVAGIIRAEFDVDLPKTFEASYRAALLTAFATELRPTEGLYQMLDRLETRCCVATSSSPPRVARTLEVLALTDRFGPHVFTASQVEHGKPAPDLFLFAARQMGADPARCLVIEDSPSGVQAGLAAGMQVWRYVGGGHFHDREAARQATPAGVPVFDNWAQLPQMGQGF